MSLEETMNAIDAALAENHPEIRASLRPGASPEALDALRTECFGGGDIPAELAALFSWHDGQDEDEVIVPEENRTFLSIAEAIEFWKFLSDPESDIIRPYPAAWIPLTWNGAGDHLVYISSGKNAGALHGYWHDDPDQGLEYDSLQEWLDYVLDEAKA